MGRKCTVCTSPRRAAIDSILAGDTPTAAIARQFHITPDALRRHKAAHLSPALVKVAVQRYGAESASVALDATVGRLEGLIARLEGLLEVAEDRRSLMGGANIAREIRSSLELIARLRGELDTRAVHTTVNVLSAPEFTALVSRLIGALAPWPQARIAAAAVLGQDDSDVIDVEEVVP